MAIRFSCEKCDRFIKVVDEKIGRKVICSSCGHTNKVPARDDVALDKLGVRTRQAPGQVEATSENMMEELVQSYRTQNIGGDRQSGYQFSFMAMFRNFLIPAAIILLFIIALVLAYNWSSGLLGD